MCTKKSPLRRRPILGFSRPPRDDAQTNQNQSLFFSYCLSLDIKLYNTRKKNKKNSACSSSLPLCKRESSSVISIKERKEKREKGFKVFSFFSLVCFNEESNVVLRLLLKKKATSSL